MSRGVIKEGVYMRYKIKAKQPHYLWKWITLEQTNRKDHALAYARGLAKKNEKNYSVYQVWDNIAKRAIWRNK